MRRVVHSTPRWPNRTHVPDRPIDASAAPGPAPRRCGLAEPPAAADGRHAVGPSRPERGRSGCSCVGPPALHGPAGHGDACCRSSARSPIRAATFRFADYAAAVHRDVPFGVVVILIAEHPRPTSGSRRSSASTSASCAGLVGAVAVGALLDLIAESWDLDRSDPWLAYLGLVKLAIGITLCYLAVSIVLTTKDDFRLVIPYVEFAKQVRGVRPLRPRHLGADRRPHRRLRPDGLPRRPADRAAVRHRRAADPGGLRRQAEAGPRPPRSRSGRARFSRTRSSTSPSTRRGPRPLGRSHAAPAGRRPATCASSPPTTTSTRSRRSTA